MRIECERKPMFSNFVEKPCMTDSGLAADVFEGVCSEFTATDLRSQPEGCFLLASGSRMASTCKQQQIRDNFFIMF